MSGDSIDLAALDVGARVLVAGVLRLVEPADQECPAMAWVYFRETGECSWVLAEDVTSAHAFAAAEATIARVRDRLDHWRLDAPNEAADFWFDEIRAALDGTP